MSKDEAQQEPVGYVKLIDTPFGKKLKPVLTVAVTVGSKLYTTPPTQEIVCSTALCYYKPAAQPAPEQYTALEQALTRLQKRYGELEAKAAVLLRCWLTDEQKLDVVADYFDHVDGDWAVKKASQLLDAYEAKLKELNA